MVQFPDRDAMTAEQAVINKAMKEKLEHGKYYRFNPPIVAAGLPTGGPEVCPAQELTFDRGFYINLIDGNHVFQGKPVNDTRVIPIPKGYEHVSGMFADGCLRECYFHVLFIGGSEAILDENQET